MSENQNNQQFIIEEEPKSNWSFLKYFKSIGRYKWWLLGASVFGAIAGYLGFKLILNPAKKTLSATYTYNLAATVDANGSFRFVDGTLYDYQDILSLDSLTEVKNSNDLFKKVNVEKIYQNSSISVEKNVTTYKDTDIVDVNFKISAKAATFPSDKVGQEFLFQLLQLPKGASEKAIDKYELTSLFTAEYGNLVFDKQISLLKNQYNSVLNSLYTLSNKFGTSVVVDESGEKISQTIQNFNNKYVTGTVNDLDTLSGALYSKYYVNYTVGEEQKKIDQIEDLCVSYIEDIKQNAKQISILQTALDELLNATTINNSDTNYIARVVDLNTRITDYKLSNAQLERELNLYGYYYNDMTEEYEFNSSVESAIKHLQDKDQAWVDGVAAFRAKINDYKSELENDTKKASKIYQDLHKEYQNKVVVFDGGYVKLSGGMSSVLGAGIGLIGVFLVASLVTAAVYIYRDEPREEAKKEEENK